MTVDNYGSPNVRVRTLFVLFNGHSAFILANSLC